MGCFLACFGFSNSRNRRKHNHKRHGSYEPLDSPVTILRLDTADSESEPRHKAKEQLSSKIRKKVSFNLNVQTYEPISVDYHFLYQENEAKSKVIDEKEETKQGVSSNSNNRYQNCRDDYDEEDDTAFEDCSDFDDYDDDHDFIINDDEDDDIESKRDDGTLEEKSNVGKSEYVHSVLKPVENLSQWRAAKAVPPSKQRSDRKENVPLVEETKPKLVGPDCRNYSKPLLQDVSVDSSLSNWLNSSST